MSLSVPFNKLYLTGNEGEYIQDAVNQGKISGNGIYTQKCQAYFEERYGIGKALLTTSCTDALEMCAILCQIEAGDEVIVPSYTFVSTANAFVLRGAKIIFCDSRSDHPGMDEDKLEELITPKTKAIVAVHYAGVACDMDKIMKLANRYHLWVVEDAAQAVNSYYTFPDGSKKALGSIGHLAAFSFHETKNIISGEGGMLAINHADFMDRAEIIWEKGTNRSAFFRDEVSSYHWMDIGSSYLPSEMNAAFLWAQIEQIDSIQKQRKKHWDFYKQKLDGILIDLPHLPGYASNNAHLFYLVCDSQNERDRLISIAKENQIQLIFHYLALHQSPYYANKHDGRTLANCDRYSNCLLRLPLFYNLTEEMQNRVIQLIITN